MSSTSATSSTTPLQPAPPQPPASPKKYLVGISLKTYFDLPQTLTYLSSLLDEFPPSSPLLQHTELFLLPSPLTLHACAQRLGLLPSSSFSSDVPNPSVQLGSQTSSAYPPGAYTGELPASHLAQMGCKYALVGHAERRRLFQETDAVVAQKSSLIVNAGMIPIICIGENTPPPPTDSASDSTAISAAAETCTTQLLPIFSLLPSSAEVVIAYEPVWAIGAAVPASARHVIGVVRAFRAALPGREGRIRVVYGGAAGRGLWSMLRKEMGGEEVLEGLFLGRFGHGVKDLREVIREVGGLGEGEVEG
ncbi:MAG: hypothetical protein M1824_003114 [Vezdaea acicularis]|nr:MAG: hypothetical protein M1824_003114 [Vezdaea acicularis]